MDSTPHRGVIYICTLEHAADKDSRNEQAAILRSYASAEIRRIPQFRGGVLVVTVDTDERREKLRGKRGILFTLNSDETDFGDDIEFAATPKRKSPQGQLGLEVSR